MQGVRGVARHGVGGRRAACFERHLPRVTQDACMCVGDLHDHVSWTRGPDPPTSPPRGGRSSPRPLQTPAAGSLWARPPCPLQAHATLWPLSRPRCPESSLLSSKHTVTFVAASTKRRAAGPVACVPTRVPASTCLGHPVRRDIWGGRVTAQPHRRLFQRRQNTHSMPHYLR